MTEISLSADTFIETKEYRRFAEFCDACRDYRYIGLCHGVPGVGKTLSARHYARWEQWANVRVQALTDAQLQVLGSLDTVFCTPDVTNTPRSIQETIRRESLKLWHIAREPIIRAQRSTVANLHRQQQNQSQQYLEEEDWFSPNTPPPPPASYAMVAQTFARQEQVLQPIRLVIIDEADRLKISSLEAVRDLFDRQSIGMILIGMPGIEKRMSRYPQLYSRIGFVHEFNPLSAQEIRQLLEQGWRPPTTQLLGKIDSEAVTSLIRITGGNFRLLQRLLVQAERILKINQLDTVTRQAVESARESLVLG
jgi:DNA transposition AAA+ family ATPase